MSEEKFIVLNTVACTYELSTAENIDVLAKSLDCTVDDLVGRTPVFQVLPIRSVSASMYNLY